MSLFPDAACSEISPHSSLQDLSQRSVERKREERRRNEERRKGTTRKTKKREERVKRMKGGDEWGEEMI